MASMHRLRLSAELWCCYARHWQAEVSGVGSQSLCQ